MESSDVLADGDADGDGDGDGDDNDNDRRCGKIKYSK